MTLFIGQCRRCNICEYLQGRLSEFVFYEFVKGNVRVGKQKTQILKLKNSSYNINDDDNNNINNNNNNNNNCNK